MQFESNTHCILLNSHSVLLNSIILFLFLVFFFLLYLDYLSTPISMTNCLFLALPPVNCVVGFCVFLLIIELSGI